MSSQSQHTRLPIEALIEAFIAFVQAETWPDSRRILQEHPELFNQEALQILRAYFLSIKDDDDSWWYQYHYGLLQFGRLISDAEYEEEGAVDNHVVVESLFESLDPSTGPDVVVPAAFTDDYQLLAELDEAASHNPMVHGDRIVIMERMVRQAENERRSFKTALLINLGVAYAQLPSDQQASNLRKAAAYFAEAAQFFTPKTAPPAYAASQN